jgi:FMN reductase
MPSVLLLSGSPSVPSRSGALLAYAQRQLLAAGLEVRLVGLRDFPAADLLFSNHESVAFEPLKLALAEASAVVVATPVYKSAYTGGLKALLDILPQTALRGKTVLPLAVGGSSAHQLAIDYALKPVLAALGATDLLQGVYFVDKQLAVASDGQADFASAELRLRFDDALQQLVARARFTVPAEGVA